MVDEGISDQGHTRHQGPCGRCVVVITGGMGEFQVIKLDASEVWNTREK